MSEGRNSMQENSFSAYRSTSNPANMESQNRHFENTSRVFSNLSNGQNYFYTHNPAMGRQVTSRRIISAVGAISVSQQPSNIRRQDNMESQQFLENIENRAGSVGINPMLLLINQANYTGRNPHAIPQSPYSDNSTLHPQQVYMAGSSLPHHQRNNQPVQPTPSYSNGMVFRGGFGGPGGRQETARTTSNNSDTQNQSSNSNYVRSDYDTTLNARDHVNGGERQAQGAPRTTVRPQFRSKVVCQLACKYCQVPVCRRGMKAILLADTNVELYSTDSPPAGVQLVNEDYTTRNCHCRIRDVACLGCGNVVGYHVTQPCETCLEACNNGHFWMFHVDQVGSSDRMDGSGSKSLLWAQLPRADRDIDCQDRYELMCR